MIIEDNEQINIIGGGSTITGAVISAFNTMIKTLYTIGQNFGTTIRRVATKTTC